MKTLTAGPLNTLLWECEAWNISKKNIKKLQSCHHTFIRRILKIKWNQVKEQQIKNSQVRSLFCMDTKTQEDWTTTTVM
jgi:hypothetical protein